MSIEGSVLFRSRATVGVELVDAQDSGFFETFPAEKAKIEFFWCVSPEGASTPVALLGEFARNLAREMARKRLEEHVKDQTGPGKREPIFHPKLNGYEYFLVMPGQEPPQGTPVQIL